MKLIDLKGWTVEYNSDSELYTITDPLGNQCITKTARIISPEHFAITHPRLPDEHIFPGRSVPCLGKDFSGNMQKLLFGNSTKIKMNIRSRPRILKTQRTRRQSTVKYSG